MKTSRGVDTAVKLLIFQISAVCFTSVLGQSNREGVAVGVHNISAPVGSQATLRCRSQRMVSIQDRLKDRQRVVHWDIFRSGPEHAVERLIDMFPNGNLRFYNAFNKGRINMSKTAFTNGNFSITIKDVGMGDKGIYSCNLHHHYCHLNESLKVQLNITKSPRKEKRFWDGEKNVFVVLVGSTVMLPCVNRRPLWTKRRMEDKPQVVHWDRRLLGIQQDRAEQLIDLYTTGQQQQYGSYFQSHKMNVSARAFSLGDFSLTLADFQPADQGLYSCHLQHPYCGIRERRIFRLSVRPTPSPDLFIPPRNKANNNPSTGMVDMPVVSVVVPKHYGHVSQQLVYILATLLLLVLITLAAIMLTCRYKKRGLENSRRRYELDHASYLRSMELQRFDQDANPLDFKNNIERERQM